jgi:hypothetical protein
VAEHSLGKGEVTRSIRVMGTKVNRRNQQRHSRNSQPTANRINRHGKRQI